MKRSNLAVLKRLEADPVTDVCMSVITKAELFYGEQVSPASRAGCRGARGVSTVRRGTGFFADDAALH
jgi:hypothetical protein